jgi:hypothetical protein
MRQSPSPPKRFPQIVVVAGLQTDILALAIAQHPELPPNQSTLPPFAEMALELSPKRLAIGLKSCVHGLPPHQKSTDTRRN